MEIWKAEIQLDIRQIRGGKVATLFSLIRDTDQSTSSTISNRFDKKTLERSKMEKKKQVGKVKEKFEEVAKSLEEKRTIALERIADSTSALVNLALLLLEGQIFEMVDCTQVMWTAFSVVAAIALVTAAKKTT